MTMQIRKAERRKAKLRLGIVGASGSGKTYTALQLAFGLGGKVGIIDTENGSGELYAHLGDYDVIALTAPYEVEKYLSAVHAFEAAKYDVIIIDSLTHAWAGEGGLLDQQGKMEASGRYKNSFATWRDITPLHNKLIETMLKSPSHIIATMRSKQEYVLEQNDRGKSIPRKVGMAPVQRDGMDYEFTVVFDLSENHYARTSKDRTGLFDNKNFIPGVDTGKQLAAWLNSGAEALPEPKPPTVEEKLGDEIPSFGEPTLAERSKAYSELVMHSRDEGELNHEILAHVHLMNEMAKDKPEWHAKMVGLIEHTRETHRQTAARKDKRAKKLKVDDNGAQTVTVSDDLNDPLPNSMKPTDADKVIKAFEKEVNKEVETIKKEDMRHVS